MKQIIIILFLVLSDANLLQSTGQTTDLLLIWVQVSKIQLKKLMHPCFGMADTVQMMILKG